MKGKKSVTVTEHNISKILFQIDKFLTSLQDESEG